jgi:hypothetical protein
VYARCGTLPPVAGRCQRHDIPQLLLGAQLSERGLSQQAAQHQYMRRHLRSCQLSLLQNKSAQAAPTMRSSDYTYLEERQQSTVRVFRIESRQRYNSVRGGREDSGALYSGRPHRRFPVQDGRYRRGRVFGVYVVYNRPMTVQRGRVGAVTVGVGEDVTELQHTRHTVLKVSGVDVFARGEAVLREPGAFLQQVAHQRVTLGVRSLFGPCWQQWQHSAPKEVRTRVCTGKLSAYMNAGCAAGGPCTYPRPRD